MNDAGRQFFELATQYYIAGRYAVFAGLNPVAGNLLHHAIEMYLKGFLAQSMSTADLKDRLSHSLPRAWRRFKEASGHPLDEFDRVVNDLHAFEDLRYPDEVLKAGMLVSFGLTRDDLAEPVQGVPSYRLPLQEIDALVARIFDEAKVNPRFFFDGLLPPARECLGRDNLQAWARPPLA